MLSRQNDLWVSPILVPKVLHLVLFCVSRPDPGNLVITFIIINIPVIVFSIFAFEVSRLNTKTFRLFFLLICSSIGTGRSNGKLHYVDYGTCLLLRISS